jgi:hypothetical protein
MFFVVFGRLDPIPAWGPGGWVVDFAPQSFVIALMSTLVPGVLTRRKLRAGRVTALPGTTRLPRNLVVRALILGAASAVLGTALVGAVAFAAQQESLAFTAALTLKVGYGALLAGLITPLGLRAALTCR